jgi:hypothetical protein
MNNPPGRREPAALSIRQAIRLALQPRQPWGRPARLLIRRSLAVAGRENQEALRTYPKKPARAGL